MKQERQKTMNIRGSGEPSFYDGLALISDPIHGYISFTVPFGDSKSETTEKDLIDSPWMQRLRYIYQLQSARWVYPSAEHSRFQHSIGAMHVAGRFAQHLYPTLKAMTKECPSEAYIEELLRVAALFHDSGHGPFGHFFDDNVLDEYRVTHEMIGQEIIQWGVGKIIRNIRRSPHGGFAENEVLNPGYAAFLIGKGPNQPNHRFPQWLVFLQPLLSGIYTADNLDYVLRDAYMCGVAIGPVDLDRLIHYTFYTERGMTLHRAGLSALNMFLNARLYMYTNVYYHRTTRAIDLHLKEIFRSTVKLLYPHNPIRKLEGYLDVTDWSLLEEVRSWKRSSVKKKKDLYPEWQKILGRDVKWKMAYDRTLPLREIERGRRFLHQDELEAEIRDRLPSRMKQIPFKVDMASQDPRPLNPLMMGDRQIYVYNPSAKTVSKEALKEYFDYIPAKVILCRIFAPDHRYDAELTEAAESVLSDEKASIKTNV
ncbi:MAG: HD domain-containing protein [Nitrospirae bacterium]|nr:HD domain-containing protein [Nitrospirota bacterium]